jgi:CCR4-NOT complex subunit CAF16
LLETLATEKSVYIMDEITTDLDLFAREGLLNFLRQETEQRGATVFYATHIFDCLSEWATHILFFSQGRVHRCCSMAELDEYHELVTRGTRVPLYTLIKQWVFSEYKEPSAIPDDLGPQAATGHEGPTIDVKSLSYAYAAGLPPVLKDMTFAIERGSRVLVTGVNGACKSTVMSILGGKRMIPRGPASALGKDCFNDTSLGREVMYMGDWWRTKFYMNLRFRELLSEEVRTSARCQYLAKILDVNFEWKINEVSDGMRRRCQLVEALAVPKSVYFMDEITSDLDIYSREGILGFLRAEADLRGATILYCTHIFDHLEGWASHILHLSQGRVIKCCPIDEVVEYSRKIEKGVSCPLYETVREWVHSEYVAIKEAEPAKKCLKMEQNLDGRIPNLGLAGPFMMTSG